MNKNFKEYFSWKLFEPIFYLCFSIFLFTLFIVAKSSVFSFNLGEFILLFFAVIFSLAILFFFRFQDKRIRRFKMVLRALFFFLLFVFIATIFIIYIFPINGCTHIDKLNFNLEKQSTGYTLIILGGGADKDNHPTPILEERLKLGLEVCKKAHISSIYVSGGICMSHSKPEGEIMKEWLKQKGVSSNLIISEKKSTSTWENLNYIKKLDPKIVNRPIILVTSRFHLLRVSFLIKRAGYSSVFFLGSKIPRKSFTPTIIRENAAIFKSLFFDY